MFIQGPYTGGSFQRIHNRLNHRRPRLLGRPFDLTIRCELQTKIHRVLDQPRDRIQLEAQQRRSIQDH